MKIAALLTCGVNEVERDICHEMMQAVRIPSYASLVRTALYHYATAHLELDIPIDAFAFETREHPPEKKRDVDSTQGDLLDGIDVAS